MTPIAKPFHRKSHPADRAGAAKSAVPAPRFPATPFPPLSEPLGSISCAPTRKGRLLANRALGGLGALALGLGMPSVAEAQGGANGKGDPTGSSKATATQVAMDSKALEAHNQKLRATLGITQLPKTINIEPTQENTKFVPVEGDPVKKIIQVFGQDVVEKSNSLVTKEVHTAYGRAYVYEMGMVCVHDLEDDPTRTLISFRPLNYFLGDLKPISKEILEVKWVYYYPDLVAHLRQLDTNKLTEADINSLYRDLSQVNNYRHWFLRTLCFYTKFFDLRAGASIYYTPTKGESLLAIADKLATRDARAVVDSLDGNEKDQFLSSVANGVCLFNGAKEPFVSDLEKLHQLVSVYIGTERIVIPKLQIKPGQAQEFLKRLKHGDPSVDIVEIWDGPPNKYAYTVLQIAALQRAIDIAKRKK